MGVQDLPTYHSPTRRFLRGMSSWGLSIVITLVAAELILQVLNPRYLRIEDWSGLAYQYDAELGWSPIPNSTASGGLPPGRIAHHNSLGLRDVELGRKT